MAYCQSFRWHFERGGRVHTAWGVAIVGEPLKEPDRWTRVWELSLAPLRGLPAVDPNRQVSHVWDGRWEFLAPWDEWLKSLWQWWLWCESDWTEFVAHRPEPQPHLLVTDGHLLSRDPQRWSQWLKRWLQVGVSKWKVTPTQAEALIHLWVQALQVLPSGRIRIDGGRCWDEATWLAFWQKLPLEVQKAVEMVEEPWPWDPLVYARWADRLPLACDLLSWRWSEAELEAWLERGIWTHWVWKPSLGPFQTAWLKVPGRILVTSGLGSWYDWIWSCFGDFWLNRYYPQKRWDFPGLGVDWV